MAKSTQTVFGVRLETQNAFAVPVIVGEVGLIREGMVQNLGKIPGASHINEVKKIIQRCTY